MHYSQISPYSGLLGSALLIGTGLGVMGQAIAQSPPPCQPPDTGEYLLMVVHQTAETPAQLEQTLPPNATKTVCNYLGNVVTRVGGFTDLEVANSWAQYLSDIGGLQAFVTRPADSTPAEVPFPTPTQTGGTATPSPTPTLPTIPPTTPSPLPTPSPQPSRPPAATPTPIPAASGSSGAIATYNPRPLGAGYAVLVDYGNRPEVAVAVRQVLTNPVGLVSYEQRPYLLATHTSDPAVAATVLRNLSDRNITALIVDSRNAILLTPAVVSE